MHVSSVGHLVLDLYQSWQRPRQFWQLGPNSCRSGGLALPTANAADYDHSSSVWVVLRPVFAHHPHLTLLLAAAAAAAAATATATVEVRSALADATPESWAAAVAKDSNAAAKVMAQAMAEAWASGQTESIARTQVRWHCCIRRVVAP